ncbi:hypothetical protein [Streptomyces sp. R41]|uniref:Uncharacterized protein n=1 Tax=Streptomyces sp. R41 TaxID=3238632 RepID=A0AB39RQC7_9ACTN
MITGSPARSVVPRCEVRRLVTAVLTALLTVPALGLAGAVPAKAATDHTQGVDATGSGSSGSGSRRPHPRPWSMFDDHSSVQIPGAANPPTGLTLGIGR